MTQTLFAKEITLDDLSEQFGLQHARDQTLFPEWQESLPELVDAERQLLERVRSNFENLAQGRSLSEEAVKMAVLSPLLDLAGFYQPPFKIATEQAIAISAEDERGIVVRGNIDVPVVLEQLWILVIESKQVAFSLYKALPQALTYMLANPNQCPTFGLITNGNDFLFVKVLPQHPPRYVVSRVFSLLNPGNDLEPVLRVLKKIGNLLNVKSQQPE
jgi:hypothetical protein